MDETDGSGFCFPYDVLLDILRRLPCRALAESRRVCSAWRSIIDGHNLQFPHFFPRGVFPGIFTSSYGCDDSSSFFTPPAACSSRPRGARDGPAFRRPLFQHQWANVIHYCNGLLLLGGEYSRNRYVCNPATVRCARLPLPPSKQEYRESMFLAFDPAVSRHYEVFLLPEGTTKPEVREHMEVINTEPELDVMPEIWQLFSHQGELLPSEKQQEIHAPVPIDVVEPKDKVISILVFSSQTDQWESREFVPGRCAPSQLYDMVIAPHPSHVKIWKTAQHWQGSLYVYCWNNIIMILRNSQGAYDMAQLPGKSYDDVDTDCEYRYDLPRSSILASYERGIHYVALDKFQLHVWTLTESDDGQVGWILSHEADLSSYNPIIQQSIEPRVLWKAVASNKAAISLFEAIVYDGDYMESSTTKDVYDDDDDDDDDNDQAEEEGIHEVDTFDARTVVYVSGDDDGHSEEGESSEDEDGEFKCEEGSVCSWDSDEDNFIDEESATYLLGDKENGYYNIIGLHPHKDVVLFRTASGVAAYHLSTSRMQYLGWPLVRMPHQHGHGVNGAFPYRPCYVDALPSTKIRPYRG